MCTSLCQPLPGMPGGEGTGFLDWTQPPAVAQILRRHSHAMVRQPRSTPTIFYPPQPTNDPHQLHHDAIPTVHHLRGLQRPQVQEGPHPGHKTIHQTDESPDLPTLHLLPPFATIVKGELLRALRATSDVETFSITASKLLERFLQRGYPREFFLRVAETVTFGDRVHLLTSHPTRTLPSNTTIFSIRHHPALPSSDIWQALQDEETPFNPMVVRSKPTSHRELLVRAKTAGRSLFL